MDGPASAAVAFTATARACPGVVGGSVVTAIGRQGGPSQAQAGTGADPAVLLVTADAATGPATWRAPSFRSTATPSVRVLVTVITVAAPLRITRRAPGPAQRRPCALPACKVSTDSKIGGATPGADGTTRTT